LDIARETYSQTISDIFANFQNYKEILNTTNNKDVKLLSNENRGYYLSFTKTFINKISLNQIARLF